MYRSTFVICIDTDAPLHETLIRIIEEAGGAVCEAVAEVCHDQKIPAAVTCQRARINAE